jgi:putative sterol carrier protein
MAVMAAQSSQWGPSRAVKTEYPADGMSGFLTPEWIAALDAAAREAAVPAGVRLTIQQIVTGDDGEDDVRYHLVIEDGRLRVHAGDAPAADVTLVQTRDVAAALSRGELNAQQALEAGRLKLRGDIGHLAREGRALTALTDVFAAVRSVTTY